MYLPGFVCGTSGLGDALGLEGTRRLSFGPFEDEQSFKHIIEDGDSTCYDLPDRRLIFCKEFF